MRGKWTVLWMVFIILCGCSVTPNEQANPAGPPTQEPKPVPPTEPQASESKPAAPQPNIGQPPSSPLDAAPSKGDPALHLPKKIDHVVIVIEENHSKQEIMGNPKAPYMNQLMNEGANLTNYHAIEHPSQPNYLDLFSGDNQGVTHDKRPPHKFTADNLGQELMEKHYTFAGYSEDLPSVGFEGVSNTKGPNPWVYARKHNPWVNFTNVPAEANQPLTHLPKDYSQWPTVSFIIPNMKHDMHDGTIQEADQWLKEHLDGYVQWAKSNHSLLIVTWDEDDQSQNNLIPTFFVGPMVNKGTFNDSWNHFNLLRTIEDIYGLSHAGKAKDAVPILSVWK